MNGNGKLKFRWTHHFGKRRERKIFSWTGFFQTRNVASIWVRLPPLASDLEELCRGIPSIIHNNPKKTTLSYSPPIHWRPGTNNNTITDGGSTAPQNSWYQTEEKTIQEHKRDWKDTTGIVERRTSGEHLPSHLRREDCHWMPQTKLMC